MSNNARVTTRTAKDSDGKSVRYDDAKILEQLTNSSAIRFYKEAMEHFPGSYDQIAEPGRWMRNKAIAIENRFRADGPKVKRPLLARLCAAAATENEDPETTPAMRIDNLPVPVPRSKLKAWVDNGFVEVTQSEGSNEIFMTFTELGVAAANETNA